MTMTMPHTLFVDFLSGGSRAYPSSVYRVCVEEGILKVYRRQPKNTVEGDEAILLEAYSPQGWIAVRREEAKVT